MASSLNFWFYSPPKIIGFHGDRKKLKCLFQGGQWDAASYCWVLARGDDRLLEEQLDLMKRILSNQSTGSEQGEYWPRWPYYYFAPLIHGYSNLCDVVRNKSRTKLLLLLVEHLKNEQFWSEKNHLYHVWQNPIVSPCRLWSMMSVNMPQAIWTSHIIRSPRNCDSPTGSRVYCRVNAANTLCTLWQRVLLKVKGDVYLFSRQYANEYKCQCD